MVNFGDFPKIHLRPGSHTRDTRARTTRCTCVQACMCKHAHRHATCACVDKAKGFNLKLLLSKGLPCFFFEILRKTAKKSWERSQNFRLSIKMAGFCQNYRKICCQFSKFRDFLEKIWKCRRSSHKSMIFRLNFMLKLCVNVCLRLNFNKKPHFTENEGFLLQISTQNRFNRNFEHNFNKNRKFKFKFQEIRLFFLNSTKMLNTSTF